MPLSGLTPLSIVFSLGNHFSFLHSHPWTSILLLAAIAVLAWWTYRLYINRLSTLSGIITVDGELLPKFRINIRCGTAPAYTWQQQQECTQGVYVVYGIPVGELVLELAWGTADSCRLAATLDVKEGTNLFDVAVSLELDNVRVRRTVTGTTASTTISWTFQEPIGSPTPVRFQTTDFKFIYWISHDYKDKAGNARSFPGQEAQWPVSRLPAAGVPWTAQVSLPDYPSSNETETWSVEVCVDGFRETKKTMKTKE